jgi:hypothetical protein
MSRESRKVFSILITILLLLRRVTILIAFIVTLARRKEREKTICGTHFPRRRRRIYSTLWSSFVRIPFGAEKTDLSHTLDSQHIYSIIIE